ncbi:MAG: hypothetical protein CMH26_02420 [Micavibrio sp.]|nr:hypothetical protein [Micavibrio sp.]|tara:strand:- start:1499 stop:2449 length:951 start_codon:yes stop_codon:yes gene_type:complete
MRSKDAYDIELLRRIEGLIRSFQGLVKDSHGQENEVELVYGLRVLVSLANMVLRNEDIFTIEPWHIISADAPLSRPGEMLLRVRDYKGEVMPPYMAIMAYYKNGFGAAIDAILFLAALWQFQRYETERQVSINISARSLRDSDFVKCSLERLEGLELEPDQKIIIEIHESAPHLSMSRHVLDLYDKFGVSFAIDDVGLNMSDIMRLGEFDGLVEYLKIDRHTVCGPEGSSNSLGNVVEFVRSLMPDVVMVAEGVRDANHAYEISKAFSDIIYVQGLYLPDDRKSFATDFYNVKAKRKAMGGEAQYRDSRHEAGDIL